MGVVRGKCDRVRFVPDLALQKLLTTSNGWSVNEFSLETRSAFVIVSLSKHEALLTARAIGRVSKPSRILIQSLIKVFYRTQSNSRSEIFLKRRSKLHTLVN